MSGLPSSLRWLSPWRANAKSGTLALTLNENAMRFVHASESNERGATIDAWGTELRGNQTREAFLKRIKNILPQAERVIAVLDPRDYQIVQVDAPNVPPEELRGAVRWRAMEFLDGSPHDFTLDILTLAGDVGGTEKVIAVAAQNDVIRARMLDCASIGRELSVIDVPETAQRNMLYALLLADKTLASVAAALVADGGRALITIVVQGELYFFRRFEFDVDKLAVAENAEDSALISNSAEAETILRSLMQLHRSFDLWDDNYPSLPLDRLVVDAGNKTAAIIERLKTETGVDTGPFDWAKIFKLNKTGAPAPWTDTAYLPLLGALLRPVAA
jgi:MSHA biogenesis protein MshI